MSDATSIFLTYSHRPHFDAGDYESFLVAHDNPFFNAVAGIARYENWRLVPPYPVELGFDYFDLIHLDGSRSLEEVWFDEELTGFRRGWVARWGYSSSPPPVVNGQGYLLRGAAVPPLAPGGTAGLSFGDAGEMDWTVIATMPKHYAYPEGAAPRPWYDEELRSLALPGRGISLTAASADPKALRARRIAP